jgi:hypothetical protein
MIIQGIFHTHSTYSHDGKLSLSKIRHQLQGSGLDFAFTAEHYDDFNEIKMKAYGDEIRDLNEKSKFLFIPGFEIDFREVHIIVYGLEKYVKFHDSQELFNYSRENPKIITILAHPSKISDSKVLEYFLERTDGFEVWNKRADGRYFDYLFLKKVKEHFNVQSKIKVFGLDLHDAKDFNYNILIFNLSETTEDSLLQSFRQGYFQNSSMPRSYDALESLDQLLDSVSRGFRIRYFLLMWLRLIASLGYRFAKLFFSQKRIENIKNKIKRVL